jgi:hypothetical protein
MLARQNVAARRARAGRACGGPASCLPDKGGETLFTPDANLFSRAEQERLFRRRAVEEAGVLFAQRGAEAAAFVARELRAQELTAEERRYHRLVILELERLDRQRRHGEAPRAGFSLSSAFSWPKRSSPRAE